MLLGTLTASTAAIVFSASEAQSKDASEIAKIAKAITVRIEGATQGSGVLVKKEGNRYTVLTAWHVVKDNRPGEEVEIITSDGKEHLWESKSLQRLGDVDMAVLTFTSNKSYQPAVIGNIKSVSSGNPIFVSGFPLPSSSVPIPIWRFLKGDVIANATVAIPDGYQLLYSNPTLPGMSGGSVIDDAGNLVGIHGRTERDDQVSIEKQKAISTGTNQAVPISYYLKFLSGEEIIAVNNQVLTADDFLVKAFELINNFSYKSSKSQKLLSLNDRHRKANRIIYLSNKSLDIKKSSNAYAYRSRGNMLKAWIIETEKNDYILRTNCGDKQAKCFDALRISLEEFYKEIKSYRSKGQEDIVKALDLDPNNIFALIDNSLILQREGDKLDLNSALFYLNKAASLNPENSNILEIRGMLYGRLGTIERNYSASKSKYGSSLTREELAEEVTSLYGDNRINCELYFGSGKWSNRYRGSKKAMIAACNSVEAERYYQLAAIDLENFLRLTPTTDLRIINLYKGHLKYIYGPEGLNKMPD